MDVVKEEAGHGGDPGKLIKQGAEARIYEASFMGRKAVVKERFTKKYRHPALDAKLTQKRLLGEARSMVKARKLGVRTPVVFAVDTSSHTLTLEFVTGSSIKDILLTSRPNDSIIEDLSSQIGKAIARLHDGGLIHGDLTTSNMIFHSEKREVVIIDFGLSFTSTLPEDKAVDIYVLERALISLHSANGNIMEKVLASYRHSSKYWSSTLNKFAQVQMRGRKRVMVG